MKEIEKLENKYIERFGSMFPNIGISEEYEKEIILECLKQRKDAYELGYFTLDSDTLYWYKTKGKLLLKKYF